MFFLPKRINLVSDRPHAREKQKTKNKKQNPVVTVPVGVSDYQVSTANVELLQMREAAFSQWNGDRESVSRVCEVPSCAHAT